MLEFRVLSLYDRRAVLPGCRKVLTSGTDGQGVAFKFGMLAVQIPCVLFVLL